MTIVKRESISRGKGKFAFPGKAKIIEVDSSQEQSLVGEYPSRLVRIKFEVILFAHESPFDDKVVGEEKFMMTQNVEIPWLQKVPYRLGQEYPCFWMDGFGMNGKHFVDGLLDEVEDFANFPPIEGREMLWIKNEFLPRAIPSIPAHWELKGNSAVLLPKNEYYDIVLEDKGVLPKQWFLYGAIANHQSYTKKFVDIINLEEGFCESVSISQEAHISGGSCPVVSEYWKKYVKTHDGNGNYY